MIQKLHEKIKLYERKNFENRIRYMNGELSKELYLEALSLNNQCIERYISYLVNEELIAVCDSVED